MENKKYMAKLEHGSDYGFRRQYATSCIVIRKDGTGIEINPEHFFNEKGRKKLEDGKKLFLFSFDIGYRKCLEMYPELSK